MIQKLEDLFHRSRALPYDVNTMEWLEANCEDTGIRREVVALLGAHAEVLRWKETS